MSLMTTQQSPHWLDQLTASILAWQKQADQLELHVDDMKTPSGRIHTGSLRGVVLHDLVAKALQEKFPQVTSTYVFNDMDSMDGLPSYLDQDEYAQYMGKPLFQIPAPKLEESGLSLEFISATEKAELEKASNFAELYAQDFIQAFHRLGCTPKIIWSHQLYESGQMDQVIRQALDGVDQLRKIYQEVADYKLPEKWYPFQVICPQCGKVGTTLVTEWDGSEVTFTCLPDKVKWAKGCGHQGKVVPFGGTGKLLWKVDWPAHWKVLGINVEGAGKDHTSAGGSRDMANAQCPAVFQIPIPFDIPYEWILVRGAKMSSSKGVGTSARAFTHLFPPEIGRFLFAANHYNQVIDFDPYSMAIPDLFDEYDHAARIAWKQESGDERQARAFVAAQLQTTPEPYFLPRFRDLANWMQHPDLVLEEKFAEIKGADLTQAELDLLVERQVYAKAWVATYAPSEFQLTPSTKVPDRAIELTSDQKHYLKQVGDLLKREEPWQPEDLQQALYEAAKATLGAKLGFQAIYLAFLGKTAGPRAAWMLLNTDRTLVLDRLKQLSAI